MARARVEMAAILFCSNPVCAAASVGGTALMAGTALFAASAASVQSFLAASRPLGFAAAQRLGEVGQQGHLVGARGQTFPVGGDGFVVARRGGEEGVVAGLEGAAHDLVAL